MNAKSANAAVSAKDRVRFAIRCALYMNIAEIIQAQKAAETLSRTVFINTRGICTLDKSCWKFLKPTQGEPENPDIT
jgi:poly-D-alanine transfer protein DltD